jgi:3-oxoacyl-[acyl-carrier protein] reductase
VAIVGSRRCSTYGQNVASMLARDLAARGVTINGLLPGAFDTDRLRTTMQGAAAKTGKPIDVVAAERKRGIPAQRFGSAEEFGAVCAFLCSLQAGYLTGQNVLLDGGAYPGTF